MPGQEEGTGRGWGQQGQLIHLLLHVDPRVVLHGVAGHEGLGDGRLAALGHVVGAVVVREQRAQAAG